MNKQINTFTIMLTFLAFQSNCPAQAQWDLGGTVDPLSSGGAGSVGNVPPGPKNANGSPGQPYLNESSYIQPSQSQTIYNNRGGLEYNSPNANIPSQYLSTLGTPRPLSQTLTPQLSPMQNNGFYNNVPRGVSIRNGLPQTSLDSFVREAGGAASHIYGDEGTFMWPPMNGFSEADTINAGIVGTNNKTLTTGHGGSKLPTASGNGTTKSGPR